MKKILVTGGNGQLGRSLRKQLGGSSEACIVKGGEAWYFSDIMSAADCKSYFLDITDPEDIGRFVRDEEIDVVVNCAGYTNVDAAEDNYDSAELLNAKAVEYLAEAMECTGGLLIHISTDYVFGQEPYNTPCTEDREGTPTGVYGLTKLHGEQAIKDSGCRFIIVRTAWLYSEFGRNFLRTMTGLTAARDSLRVVFDQTGTPTYASDLADVLIRIVECGCAENEIYHYSNEGVCSWYDFAKAIAVLSGNTACDIQPCHSGEFPSKVLRPAYSVLDKTKIKTALGITIPHWTESLKICIDNLI